MLLASVAKNKQTNKQTQLVSTKLNKVWSLQRTEELLAKTDCAIWTTTMQWVWLQNSERDEK